MKKVMIIFMTLMLFSTASFSATTVKIPISQENITKIEKDNYYEIDSVFKNSGLYYTIENDKILICSYTELQGTENGIFNFYFGVTDRNYIATTASGGISLVKTNSETSWTPTNYNLFDANQVTVERTVASYFILKDEKILVSEKMLKLLEFDMTSSDNVTRIVGLESEKFKEKILMLTEKNCKNYRVTHASTYGQDVENSFQFHFVNIGESGKNYFGSIIKKDDVDRKVLSRIADEAQAREAEIKKHEENLAKEKTEQEAVQKKEEELRQADLVKERAEEKAKQEAAEKKEEQIKQGNLSKQKAAILKQVNNRIWINKREVYILETYSDESLSESVNYEKLYWEVKVTGVQLNKDKTAYEVLVLVNNKNKAKVSYNIWADIRRDSKPNVLTSSPETVYKFGNTVWKKLNKGKVWNGMTKLQLELIMYAPDMKNSYGVIDQWVYGSDYLNMSLYYFKNDKLFSYSVK